MNTTTNKADNLRRMHLGNIKRIYALDERQARVFQELEFQAKEMKKPHTWLKAVAKHLTHDDFNGSLGPADRAALQRAITDFCAKHIPPMQSLLGDDFMKKVNAEVKQMEKKAK